MNRRELGSAAAAAALALSAESALAQAKAPLPKLKGQLDGEKPDPKTIWEGGLEKLAGTYRFVQVASPGGLWERTSDKDGKAKVRQLSINEAPAALREQILKSEIVISDLVTPTQKQSDARVSPSGRGVLRFYAETTTGKLTMKGLPGVGLDSEMGREFTGPVTFALEHQSHSNPSVSGILLLRGQTESTWGAATIDFATLTAGTAPPANNPEADGMVVIANARSLRSAIEIFSYVEWRIGEGIQEVLITGSIRLGKVGEAPGSGAPQPVQPAPVKIT